VGSEQMSVVRRQRLVGQSLKTGARSQEPVGRRQKVESRKQRDLNLRKADH
jgi:hypothetical protein